MIRSRSQRKTVDRVRVRVRVRVQVRDCDITVDRD